MSFERGFKAWAERTSSGIRKALQLADWEPLAPSALATHLGVELLEPHQVEGLTVSDLGQLKKDKAGWSAVTVPHEDGNVVVYNPLSSLGRRASDIMHELAHIILAHPPATVFMSHEEDIGMRSFDKRQEDQASWLAWCLLLPRPALIHCRKRRLSDAEIATTYGVSGVLVRFRLAKTGVDLVFRRGAGRSSLSVAGAG